MLGHLVDLRHSAEKLLYRPCRLGLAGLRRLQYRCVVAEGEHYAVLCSRLVLFLVLLSRAY